MAAGAGAGATSVGISTRSLEGAADGLRQGGARGTSGADARELRHAIPQVYAGYKQLQDSALAPGALDARTKELIALAIAVSKECDGCIAAHAHAAVQHGASPQEAAEAIGVTFLMNGGPATVYGARAFAAFQEFYSQQPGQPDGHQPAG